MNILRLPKLLYSCVAFCCCQALTVSLSAQQQKADTARTYSIPEVTVAEAYHTREVRAMAPTQVFSKEELKSLNVLQVSDAVKHFAGVTVKDYGGIHINAMFSLLDKRFTDILASIPPWDMTE